MSGSTELISYIEVFLRRWGREADTRKLFALEEFNEDAVRKDFADRVLLIVSRKVRIIIKP